jgi:hypothetical protein
MRLERAFPSEQGVDIGSLSLGFMDAGHSVSSSLGIDNINRRNEERLRLLEKVENTREDELTKLDDLLFSYLNDNKASDRMDMPMSRGGKPTMNAIYE